MKSYLMAVATLALIASAVNATPCPKTFGNSTLRGSYIMTINPDNRSNLNNNPSTSGAVLGLLTFDGGGNFSGNVMTTPGPTSGPVSGTYSINGDGTGTATVQTGPNPPFDRLGNGLPYTWLLLLNDRCGQLASFQDHQNVDNIFNPGALIKRTGSAFTTSSLNGNYVAIETGLNKVVLALMHFDGAGNITANVSQDGSGFGLGIGEGINGTYSVNADGTGQVHFSEPPNCCFVDSPFPWQFIIQDTGNSAFFIDPDQNVYVGGELYPTVGDYGTFRKQH